MFTSTIEMATTSNSVVTSEVKDAIVTRYLAGESQVAIAEELALATVVVRHVLKERRAPPHPKCPVSGPHEQAILSLHAGGKSIKEISNGLGVNFATVYRILLRNGRVKKKHRARK